MKSYLWLFFVISRNSIWYPYICPQTAVPGNRNIIILPNLLADTPYNITVQAIYSDAPGGSLVGNGKTRKWHWKENCTLFSFLSLIQVNNIRNAACDDPEKMQICKTSSDLKTFPWWNSITLNCYKAVALETLLINVQWTSSCIKHQHIKAFIILNHILSCSLLVFDYVECLPCKPIIRHYRNNNILEGININLYYCQFP